jgi:hypothetical protein
MARSLLQVLRQPQGVVILSALVLLLAGAGSYAGPLEQAKRIHDRLAGVPPSEAVLKQMASELEAGNGEAAAYLAMQNDNFYDITLKTWAAPWTNREQSAFVPLNDYIATVVGLVRDEADFRQLLYGDIIYIGQGITPAYSAASNAHYETLEREAVSLQDALVQQPQSSVTGLPPEATAGVLTSRAAAKAFLIAGTNRANFRFTLMNHLCVDLEQVKDASLPPDRIRQDVSRSPGGDARVFLNNCVACHSGMDPMAQAFAYYDFVYENDPDSGRIDYNSAGETDPATGTRVKAKYHINSATFPYGYVTPNDNWDNYWRQGVNQRLGWDEALTGSGAGAKSMGQELAHSAAFAQCQVKKVFRTVCLRNPADATDRSTLDNLLATFTGNGYNLKQVFAQTADYCKGD